jgi:hypothetical protein
VNFAAGDCNVCAWIKTKRVRQTDKQKIIFFMLELLDDF